jgi:hypothetical protein
MNKFGGANFENGGAKHTQATPHISPMCNTLFMLNFCTKCHLS